MLAPAHYCFLLEARLIQYIFCFPISFTWGVQVVKSPNFFSGMEADRNMKVVGGDVTVL